MQKWKNTPLLNDFLLFKIIIKKSNNPNNLFEINKFKMFKNQIQLYFYQI